MTGSLPPETPETASWWEHTRERRLMVQRCSACGHNQFYPRALCLTCRSTDLDLASVSGHARVRSFTVVHRAPDPDAFDPPYVVALVALAEGPTLTTNLVGADPDSWTCDEPVSLDWVALEDGRHLPVFVRQPT